MKRLVLLSLSSSLACAGGPPRADSTSPAAAGAQPVVDAKWPEEPFRATQPAPRPLPETQIPAIQTFKLQNGMDVYLVERHELPIVSVTVSFDTGAIADPKGKYGLSSLAFDLVDEGTADLDKVAFEERLADLASSISSYAGLERAGVRMQSLRRNLEPTLDLLAQVLSKPGMRQADLDRLKEGRKSAIAQSKASPAPLGARLWDSVVYGPEHPYGHVEDEAALAKITLADCKKIWSKVGPKDAELFVFGDVTRADVENLVGDKTAAWKGPGVRAGKIAQAKPRKGTVFFVDVPGAAQSAVYVGHGGPLRTAPDYEATLLMSRILGGGFSSRVNMNLREKNGYTYGARAGFSYNRKGGGFSASSQIRTDATVPALREILNELKAMRTGEPTAEELGREKEGTLLSLPSQFETGGSTLGAFSTLVFFGLPLDYYDGYQKRLAAVAAPDVKAAAEKHLQDGGLKVLVVGDGAVFRKDLEALAAEGAFGKEGFVVLDPDGKIVK